MYGPARVAESCTCFAPLDLGAHPPRLSPTPTRLTSTHSRHSRLVTRQDTPRIEAYTLVTAAPSDTSLLLIDRLDIISLNPSS